MSQLQVSPYALAQAKRLHPYLSESVQRRCDSIAFARSFEYVEKELNRIEYLPLQSEVLIPSGSFGASEGHKKVTYRIIEDTGSADFLDHHADDQPRADVNASEFSIDMQHLAIEYAWTVMELDAVAADPTIRLDVERKRSAMDAARRKHDEIAAIGSTKFGLKGFLNSTIVPLVSPITGGWSAATADQVIADVQKLMDAPRVATGNNHEADTLIVDDTNWAVLNKPRANTDTTVREWLLKNIRNLKTIEPWSRLNLGNAAGNGPRAVAYKKDPAVVRYYNVLLMKELPPQHRNYEVKIPCYGVTGFTNIRRPKAIAYMDGI